ncbi:MAG: queuosine biosynthesis protein [Actinobacteria bacterium 13_2_20CM_2_71_6]|nr:MAG: queuosine biosynthesis protein [Actinobacteria bacterium 13_2_20CM_2_71_6]
MSAALAPRTRFALPAELSATQPPEARGLRRDEVRLLVAEGSTVWHARFRDLGRFLAAGDVVVVNTSGTLAAAVDTAGPVAVDPAGPAAGPVVHFSTPLDSPGEWVAELRRPDQSGPIRDARPGSRIALPGGGSLTLLDHMGDSDRLWRVRVEVPGTVPAYLNRYGRPISYSYLRGRWPLSAYQTVFANEPGSAEMPSAGRPFTHELVAALVSAGVTVAPITLHTGVSSLESGEPPQPERFRVPASTAGLVNLARANGGRVVAVGTTVARALETVALPDGSVRAGAGWTDLVLGPDRPARVVDGLITGLHEPEASHLLLLEAIAGPALVQRTYDAAIEGRYLWHEFGDSCLLLPARG